VSGLVAGIIVVGAAVAGCAQTKTTTIGAGKTSAPQVTSTSLCADQATVSQVRVARIPSIAQLDPGKPGRSRIFTITIANPAKVRELARAICSLPAAPHAVSRCAVNTGGGYQLAFSAMHARLSLVAIQAAGCQRVTGAGKVRLAASTGFWTTFSQATGIKAPAHGK
jgi:hypothetical protein